MQLLSQPSMASASLSGFKTLPSSTLQAKKWRTSFLGEETVQITVPVRPKPPVPSKMRPRMGNVNEGKGVFAPIVVVVRNIVGKKRFNQLRGKAIALHSQVITEFCKTIGADPKQRQGLIRLAKKNGEKLGFLA